jgi:hypothetical protein
MWSRRFFVIVVTVALCGFSAAQQAPPTPDKSALANVEDLLEKQFGDQFKALTDISPMIADLDGDGVDDIVIAATAKNPLMDAAEHKFKVIDPYYGFFGVGDPKITSTFASTDPQTTAYVLVIVHGSGTDAWQSEQPKAKFVVINLPFKKLAVKRLQVRKKVQNAIYAVENSADGMTSAIYFDGKKYKYEPMGSELH